MDTANGPQNTGYISSRWPLTTSWEVNSTSHRDLGAEPFRWDHWWLWTMSYNRACNSASTVLYSSMHACAFLMVSHMVERMRKQCFAPVQACPHLYKLLSQLLNRGDVFGALVATRFGYRRDCRRIHGLVAGYGGSKVIRLVSSHFSLAYRYELGKPGHAWSWRL